MLLEIIPFVICSFNASSVIMFLCGKNGCFNTLLFQYPLVFCVLWFHLVLLFRFRRTLFLHLSF